MPFDRWRELNADGVVIGTVQKTAPACASRCGCSTSRSASVGVRRGVQRLGGEPAALCAHDRGRDPPAQRALRGVARTKLTFNSDRDGRADERTVENRERKEIYISDYDGENQRQVTINRSLNINSVWSPDGRSIAYTSYRRGRPNIFISNIYAGHRLASSTKAERPELAAGVVARRHAARLQLDARRQPRDLRR